MNSHAHVKAATGPTPTLIKTDPNRPALVATGATSVAIRGGTTFAGHLFAEQTSVAEPDGGYIAGRDYAVIVPPGGTPCAVLFDGPPSGDLDRIGGFHFAPGGNAAARAGGDETPAINPHSLWDINFRPACPDPRGMTLVEAPGGRFWCDIYLLGVDHLTVGTSRFGEQIADHRDRPGNPRGKPFLRFDYDAAVAVMAHHGKGLLSDQEFYAATYGVTERTAADGDPERTGLDAPRTSKWGVMQAAGNMWVLGHAGDPDTPRASIFGGSWWDGGYAGSRYASVGHWPGYSGGYLGARGRSDHLQPA